MTQEEDLSKVKEMQAAAEKAPPDMEALIRRLDNLAAARRPDPALEREYEHLRDLLTKILAKEGPRYYLDSAGVKRYAFAVVPEPVEINLPKLIAMAKAGQISDELLEKLAPRKVDKDAYRRAGNTGKLTKAQVAATSKFVKGTGHVKFSDPYDAA